MQLTALSLALTRIGLGGFGVGSALNLDFTSGNQSLDPRITFSRASNATVTGPDGTLGYAPHNLLTHSEQFDNAAWAKTRSSISANTAVAPDGTTTADKLADDGASAGIGYIGQNFTWAGGVTYTGSFYVKAEEYSSVSAYFTDQSGITAGTSSAFNLSSGTVTSGAQCSIQPVGDGWYRVAIYGSPAAGSGTLRILLTTDTASSNGLYLWGAQLNVGPLQPYYPTTVKNLLGYTQEFDNAAWTKSNSFVQTNLLTWSEQFDNAGWSKVDFSTTANAITAPDGSLTAERVTRATTTNTFNAISQSASILANTRYSLSCYVKADQYKKFGLREGASSGWYAAFDLTSGTVIETFGTGLLASITPVGDGWYRCEINLTVAITTFGVRINPLPDSYTSGSVSYSWGGNTTDGLFIWGAQLVQGSTPGDYQRTEGTARAVMYPAPDGSRTADKLVEDAASAVQHQLFVTPTVVTNTTYVMSIYAKAAERSLVRILAFNGSGDSESVAFNLVTGTTTVVGDSTATMTSVGGGWYRCAMTFVNSVDTGTTLSITLANSSGSYSYTGDGTSGIYIWGAQLSDSASLDPYVYNPAAAPAASAYYGPRFDYDPVTLQPKGLLIEEQRTNSIRNSTMVGAVAGTPGTLPTNWSLSANSGMSVNVISTEKTQGIDTITLRFFGTPSINNTRLFFDSVLPAASDGQTWVGSAYCQLVSSSVGSFESVALRITGPSITLDEVGVMVVPTEQIQRFERARTLAGGFSFAQAVIRFGFAVGVPIDLTFRIGLPQLELGAFATSVIPTTTASATRAADVAVMTGANFSSWYRQDEGTLFAEYAYTFAGLSNHCPLSFDNGASSETLVMASAAGGIDRPLANTGGVAQLSAGLGNFVYVSGQVIKRSVGYKTNDFGTSANGSAAATDNTYSTPLPTQLTIGAAGYFFSSRINGHIRKIAYFPRRLTNSELQGITS